MAYTRSRIHNFFLSKGHIPKLSAGLTMQTLERVIKWLFIISRNTETNFVQKVERIL